MSTAERFSSRISSAMMSVILAILASPEPSSSSKTSLASTSASLIFLISSAIFAASLGLKTGPTEGATFFTKKYLFVFSFRNLDTYLDGEELEGVPDQEGGEVNAGPGPAFSLPPD